MGQVLSIDPCQAVTVRTRVQDVHTRVACMPHALRPRRAVHMLASRQLFCSAVCLSSPSNTECRPEYHLHAITIVLVFRLHGEGLKAAAIEQLATVPALLVSSAESAGPCLPV